MSKKQKTKIDQISTENKDAKDSNLKDLSKKSEEKRIIAQKTIEKRFGERK